MRTGAEWRGRETARAKGLFRSHHVLDDADDGHQNATANAARRELTNDRANVETASRCSRIGNTACAHHVQKLTAKAATKNADNGVTQSAKAEVLHKAASGVAAKGTCDKADDKFHDTRIPFPAGNFTRFVELELHKTQPK